MSHSAISPTLTESRELTEAVQRIADRAVRSRRVHGLVLGIDSDDGTVSVRVAAGDADASQPYVIASITKMFTTAVIFQLIDEGRLRLDDRIVPLLPNIDLDGLHVHDGIDSTDHLEVHHLLHQTSGLADYFTGNFEDRLSAGEDISYSIEDTVDVARTSGAEFAVGDRDGRRSHYSDTNWQLLTGVVEAVTGEVYADVVRERVVEPLDLTDTYVSPAAEPRPAPAALRRQGRVLSIPDALASERGGGSIVSTLDDQLRFSRAFHAGELFAGGFDRTAADWNRVLTFAIGYGNGVMRYRLPRWMTGRRIPEMLGHSGSTASFLFRIPDLGCHVAGTFNEFADPARPFRLLPRLASVIAAGQTDR